MKTLELDHRVLDEMLRGLIIQLGKADLPQAFEALDRFWASLAVHIRAENICLFPAILNSSPDRFATAEIGDYSEAKETIEQLRTDHSFFMSELGQAMKAVRSMIMYPEYSAGMTISELRDRIIKLAEKLDEHNAIEETQVYRWPELLFDGETLERLSRGIRSEIENMPARFAMVS